MLISFTKMQGAGNDFIVLDETAGVLQLTNAQYRWLADRHFGIGADQILSVRAVREANIDFEYVIHNADGSLVEHCGNGARCFVRFVREKGLTAKSRIRVKIATGVIELIDRPDGQVTVDMGDPVFDLARVPFNPTGLASRVAAGGRWWLLPVPDTKETAKTSRLGFDDKACIMSAQEMVEVAVLSMGNPHAVQLVSDVDNAPVLKLGALIERHSAFPERVNVGFMQIVSRSVVRLRVYERGAGETLACGTGACAAVVAGVSCGLLDSAVLVHARGGDLTIEWAGDAHQSVRMTGPAQTVFHGEIDIPQF
jgi:diaminopimelate epimerase